MATDENNGVSVKVSRILFERCNQPPWSLSGHVVGRWPWLTLRQFRGQCWVHCWCYLLLVFTLSRVLAVSPMSVQSRCQCGYTELLFSFASLLCVSQRKKRKRKRHRPPWRLAGSALITLNGLKNELCSPLATMIKVSILWVKSSDVRKMHHWLLLLICFPETGCWHSQFWRAAPCDVTKGIDNNSTTSAESAGGEWLKWS